MSVASGPGANQPPVRAHTTHAFGRFRAWQLWTIPRRGAVFAIVVELCVATFAAIRLATDHASGSDIARAALLAGICVGYAELGDRVERIRRFLYAGTQQVRANPISTWALAAALLLPPGLAAAVITIVYAHILYVGHRHHSVRPYKQVFSCAANVAGALAATAPRTWISHFTVLDGGAAAAGAILTALALYTGVSLALTIVATRLFNPAASWRTVLPSHGDLAFEGATLLLGVGTAELVLHLPWLTPTMAVVVAILHRSAMVAQLEAAARTDGKTGLLNATAWHERAEQHLTRAHRLGQPVAVLVLDMDHFKSLNDQHGHLAGDTALRAVADCLRRQLRGYDIIGRHGGEEFVALLDNVTPIESMRIAERLLDDIRTLVFDNDMRVTASVGLAAYPTDATNLDELFHLADGALYVAKRNGRDHARHVAA